MNAFILQDFQPVELNELINESIMKQRIASQALNWAGDICAAIEVLNMFPLWTVTRDASSSKNITFEFSVWYSIDKDPIDLLGVDFETTACRAAIVAWWSRKP